jgi:hypothetical protein
MLNKSSCGAAPLALATKALCALGLAMQIAGCSSSDGDIALANKKLEQANQKIATLEVQLAQAQAAAQRGTVPATAAPSPTVESEATTGQQWDYRVNEEKMTGGKRRIAAVESTNTVDFGFPYSGSQHGSLVLRTDPQYGKDILFRIEKGQILCTSYEGCAVQVRFDDEKPSNFTAAAAADQSSDVIFLHDYNRFLAKLRKAKRVRLAVNIYQQGTPIFEFDVSGFNFDKYQSKS